MATHADSPGTAAIRWSVLLAFGAPAAGYAFYLFFVQFYFLKFATDVLLLSPAVMGLLFGLCRVWDAASDPLVGYWSDRTASRAGRRRPWMLAGVPLLAGFFLMVWSPPAALSGSALVAWCGVGLLGIYTAYTIYSVPHISLGAELSGDHHERSRVFGAQRMSFIAGMLLAFVGIGYVAEATDRRAAVQTVAWAGMVGGSLLLLLTPARVRERSEHVGRGAQSPFGALRDVWRNPHARLLLAAWFVEGLGSGALGVLAPFYAEYVLGRADLMAAIPGLYVVASVVSVPVWIALSRRFGKRNVWLVAIALGGGCFGGTFFVSAANLAPIYPLLLGAGFAGGCGGVIGASILADVIDWDELQSGERKEGAYSAAWGFAFKLAMGFVVMATGAALQAAGFRPNVEQGSATLLVLRGMIAFGPLLGALCAIAILSRLRLDEAEHARIRRELDARQAGRRPARSEP